jgi:hypothetical protein
MSVIHFSDHPEFRPNLSPKQIFELGSFGGTYWRPIHSRVTGKNYANQHLKYNWNLPDNIMTKPWSQYDVNINKYKVKVGTTLEYWEDKGWIKQPDLYGWVQWYAEFYNGRRIPNYDDYQIKRWINIKNRFSNRNTAAVKQTLQHWAIVN